MLFEHFWVEAGPAEVPEAASPDFVMTPSISAYLRSMARAILLKRYPILLQGEPSSHGVSTGCLWQIQNQAGHATCTQDIELARADELQHRSSAQACF